MKTHLLALLLSLPLLTQAQPGVPSIISFSPLAADAGASVIITGTNFNSVAASNLVHFGSVNGRVNSATTTQLIVTVPAGALYDYITVTTNHRVAWSPVPFTPTFAGTGVIDEGSFVVARTIATDHNPAQIFIEDLDADGLPDLIAPARPPYFKTNALVLTKLFPNTTVDNILAFDNTRPVRNFYNNVCVVDTDGDGLKDLVSDEETTGSTSTLDIFNNTGVISGIGGTHSSGMFMSQAINNCSIVASDMDLDGQNDLIVASNEGHGGIEILPNVNGSYPEEIQRYDSIDDLPDFVTVADLDGDKLPDVIVPRGYEFQLRVYPNVSTPGDVKLSKNYLPLLITPDIFPHQIVTGDVDGDGRVDIIMTTQVSISIFRNTSAPGHINFETPLNLLFKSLDVSAAVGDLNGDGRIDIAVTLYDSSVTVLKNLITSSGPLSAASFAPGVRYNLPGKAVSVAIGDLNNDGAADLAVVCNDANEIVLLQNTTGNPPGVSEGIKVYNGISPNDNGENDIWVIKNINLIADTKVNHVSILNRWGDIIYEADNYDNTTVVFTGRNKNGDELPDGVYFYKVTFASGHKALTGYLSLKK